MPENTPYDKEWKRQAVGLLLQKGADRTIRDRQGKTAYDYAVEDNDSFLAGLIKPEVQ